VVTSRNQNTNGSVDATATPSSLAPVKYRKVYLSGMALAYSDCQKNKLWNWCLPMKQDIARHEAMMAGT